MVIKMFSKGVLIGAVLLLMFALIKIATLEGDMSKVQDKIDRVAVSCNNWK